MLFSFALMITIGLALSGIFEKIKLPGLLGMVITGIILGPYMLDLIDPSILNISANLREISLMVILIRAGLALDIKDLKKVGRPAILMCFIPATFEVAATIIFAPMLFGISYVEAAVMGTVLAAVSPAVIVPRMLKLMEAGYGVKKGIPQLIMAGASADDIYVIVLFIAFLGMLQEQGASFAGFMRLPVSIVLGLVLGIVTGLLFVWLFRKVHMRDTVKILLLFSAAFFFISLEQAVQDTVFVSGLLAVVVMGSTILKKYDLLAKRLASKYSKIWVAAELLLFVLVGVEVDIRLVGTVGFTAVVLIIGILAFRMLGVFVCLIRTRLNRKEKIFAAISYLPKATVQAAIGSIPLATGVSAGNLILAVAVFSIIITAPIGAIGIDCAYKRLLKCSSD